MINSFYANVIHHHSPKWVAVILILCLFFGAVQPQPVLGASYVDDFSTSPFGSTPATSFTTGTVSTGLSYSCSNCDFDYGSQEITYRTITAGSASTITIVSRSGDPFSFTSLDLDTAIPVTVRGTLSGVQAFSVTATPDAGTYHSFGPSSSEIVDTVTISSSSSDFMDDFFDNVRYSFGPTLTSFTRETPSTSLTNADTLTFRATFSESVNNVDNTDFVVNGSTATVNAVSGSASIYYITISGGNLAGYNGEVGINLSNSHDISSTNGAVPNGEPSTDETYTLDNTGPTVTINQAGGQSDPATSGPINFAAVFDQSVSDFATGDVTLSGTAGATTATVTGSGTTYNVAVTGMTGDGTVIATIGAGVASDSLGNPSSASTSTDNQVTFDGIPEIDIQRPAGSSNSIADGGTDALGNQSISSTVNLTYTVDNSAGTDTLTVSNITASSLSNVSNFSLGTTVPFDVAGGTTATFDISFDITYNGAFNFDMAVANTDSDENPYNITVSGTGTGGAPEIDIQRPAGAPNSITDGGSDALGNQAIGTVNLTYTIDNTAGTDQLNITGVTASNESNVSGFILNTATPINIAAGSTGSFSISFTVGINGAFSFDMDIANNDSTENPYNIAVSGTGTGGAPEIDIQRPASTSIADGGSDLVGNHPVGTVNLTYIVDNSTGTDQLSITNVTAANLVNASGFSLGTVPPINIAAGATGSFSVSFSVPSAGAFSLDMDITNNDTDESNYDIAISGAGYIEPEIAVSYNSTNISDGDSTPSTADGTDFGLDLINYLPQSPEHTFTISNSGAGPLLLTNSPRVSLTGTGFSLVTDAPISIAPGASATFTVRFAATSVVTSNGTISIDSNDTDENPFNFSITGSGYSGPMMIVQGGTTPQNITNGDTTPDTADNTEFQAALVSGGTVDHTFTIENVGSGILSLSGTPVVSIGGTNAADFTVTSQPGASVGAGGTDTFTIRFDPSAVGNRTATVSIQNNDPNRNPYTFAIEGQGDEVSVVSSGGTSPTNGSSLSAAPNTLNVQFSRSVLADGSSGAANYTGNYMLVEAGVNTVFDTISCAGGVVSDDTQLSITSISYNNLSYIATLSVNSAEFVNGGNYRLYVCGTTSVEDIYGNELNGGTSDIIIGFTISLSSGGASASVLPATGFPISSITTLSEQPQEKSYSSSNMILEISSLGIDMPIVGVPLIDGEWDVSWLADEAGYLYGTAYPTWKGNTVLTGHVWDAYNTPGPFFNLKNLKFGDQIKIHSGKQTYVYEVHDTRLHKATSVNSVITHEDMDWLTLITCEEYQENNQTYAYRRVVRAVLIEVTTD